MHKIGVGEAKNCIFMHFFAYLYKVVHLDTDLKMIDNIIFMQLYTMICHVATFVQTLQILAPSILKHCIQLLHIEFYQL
jgi:hypothetical protein